MGDKQDDDGSSYTEIAVPLIGKQGAYGVLHLFLHDEIEEADLQLIGILGIRQALPLRTPSCMSSRIC
ncbi:hypothetical protein RE628_09320 [Paenibacillus sp. D2_2]|uniref:hypothetical protein n=1 Tax=Paenibacillus sp. D2_2 TaxID=3073092 RepID=UPI0028158423|nr:hypothetical protein [Paenibacillus sp. D2_2]WMT42515.1 hypothetical protein RE628_09320 [Paenibacillus sp. D2_2]